VSARSQLIKDQEAIASKLIDRVTELQDENDELRVKILELRQLQRATHDAWVKLQNENRDLEKQLEASQETVIRLRRAFRELHTKWANAVHGYAPDTPDT